MNKVLFLLITVALLTVVQFGQSITLTAPNGGEYYRGANLNVTWIAEGTTNGFKITLWRNNTSVGTIDSNIPPGNGSRSFTWSVGSYQGGTAEYGHGYQIKVKEKQADVSDMSDSMFRIKQRFTATGKPELIKKKYIPSGPIKFLKPKINAVLDVPLGALKAGSKLYVKGENFGQNKGKILIYGKFPNNPVELENVVWEDDKRVNGVMPQWVNGIENHQIGVVVKPAAGLASDPWSMSFEGRETKLLTQDAVSVDCGQEGNYNVCNQGSDCPPEYAIAAWHKNVWGAVGDDVDVDKYAIELKNGWVFKKIEIKKLGTSSDEKVWDPVPGVPIGQSNWYPVIKWKVTSNDVVFYRIKVWVEGPIGTHFK